ncbi:MAG: DUF1109 domain-containing protein [Rhizobiales bacterium]|nr:DUF1109 domain-containing protein [Hyphomicrobiales bacterium]
MKTDDLVLLLAADAGRVDTSALSRAIWLAAAFALAATAALVLATLGARAHMPAVLATAPVLAKLALGGAVSALALTAYDRSLRPGRADRRRLLFVLLPIAMVVFAALVALGQAPLGDWPALTFGRTWRACLIAIPAYGLAPLGVLLALARRAAPIDLRLTGAAAGLASAGVATMAYSLHCPEDALPFVASWYPVGMIVTAIIGALIAPKLIRW